MIRTGLRVLDPRSRATRLPLRGLGPSTVTSTEGKPASFKRFAIASAALVLLPTESVVLISINSWRIALATVRLVSCACNASATDARKKKDFMLTPRQIPHVNVLEAHVAAPTRMQLQRDTAVLRLRLGIGEIHHQHA